MKTTFITILSGLYLVSGIGFASVQYYCQSMHTTACPDHDGCCHSDSASGQAAHEDSQDADMTSGSVVEHADVLNTHGKSQHDSNCCRVEYNYNQLNSRSLLMNVDMPDADDKVTDEFYPLSFPAPEQCGLKPMTVPSSQRNLPLLI